MDSNEKILRKLHENRDLWSRLKIYHYDLKKFSSNDFSCTRLSNTHQKFFMSDCYFNDDERQFLLDSPSPIGSTLKNYFMELQRTKQEAGAVLCSSHDLAPVIEEVFGIRKGYENEKAFLAALKKMNKATKGTS